MPQVKAAQVAARHRQQASTSKATSEVSVQEEVEQDEDTSSSGVLIDGNDEPSDPFWVTEADMASECLAQPGAIEKVFATFLYGRIIADSQQGAGVIKYSNPWLLSRPEETTVTVMWAKDGREEQLPFPKIQAVMTSEFADLPAVPWQILEHQQNIKQEPRKLGGVFGPGGRFAPTKDQLWPARKASFERLLADYHAAPMVKHRTTGVYYKPEAVRAPPAPAPQRKMLPIPDKGLPSLEELVKKMEQQMAGVDVANVYSVLGIPDKDKHTTNSTTSGAAKKGAIKKVPAAASKPTKKARAEGGSEGQPKEQAAAAKSRQKTAPKAGASKPPLAKSTAKVQAPKAAAAPKPAAAKPPARSPGKQAKRKAEEPACEDEQPPSARKHPRTEADVGPSTSAAGASGSAPPPGWRPVGKKSGAGKAPTQHTSTVAAAGAAPGAGAGHDTAVDLSNEESILSWTGRRYPKSLCYKEGDLTLHVRKTTGEGSEEAEFEVDAIVDEMTFKTGRWRFGKARKWFLLKWKGYELDTGDGNLEKGDWEPLPNVKGCDAWARWCAAKPDYYTSVPDPEGY